MDHHQSFNFRDYSPLKEHSLLKEYPILKVKEEFPLTMRNQRIEENNSCPPSQGSQSVIERKRTFQCCDDQQRGSKCKKAGIALVVVLILTLAYLLTFRTPWNSGGRQKASEESYIFNEKKVVDWTTSDHCQISHYQGYLTGRWELSIQELVVNEIKSKSNT